MRTLANNSNSITFEIDSSIYSNQVLTKCLYWYTSQFNVSINDSADGKGKVIVLEFKDKRESLVGDKLAEKLKQDLIDYNLREIVEKETKIIRELLIAKAFSNYQSPNPKSEISDPVGFNPQSIIDVG
jgi:His-Xaa-Ser system protein HxsD